MTLQANPFRLLSRLVSFATAVLLCGNLVALTPPVPTQIVLTTPNANVGNHTAVVLTATVTAPLQPVNQTAVYGGTVTFYDGLYQLGTATVQFTGAGFSTAVLTVSLGAGSHSLTASYGGTTAGSASNPPYAASATASALVLAVTGTEPGGMYCVLYTTLTGVQAVATPSDPDPTGYFCAVYGFALSQISGYATLTDVTTSAAFPSAVATGSYIIQDYAGYLGLPIPVDSFLGGDFGNRGAAGLIGISTTQNTIAALQFTPQTLSVNSSRFGGFVPEICCVGNPSYVQTQAVGTAPVQGALADVNGDGSLDLVLAHNDPTGQVQVGVLLGNGSQAFQGPYAPFQNEVTYSLGNTNAVTSVALGDVNGDGFPDIVATNNGQLTVLINNGAGAFSAAGSFAAGNGASQTNLADLNGDGILDIAVMNVADTTIGVLLGNGDGTFQPMATFPSGPAPVGFAIGDLNNDGIPDITVAGSNAPPSGALTFLTGQNPFGYSPQTYSCDLSNGGNNAQYTSIQATDLDGDGIPDLIFGFNFSGISTGITNPNQYPPHPTFEGCGYFLNANNGTVAQGNSTATSGLAVADFTGAGVKGVITIPPSGVYGVIGLGTSVFGTPQTPFNVGPPFGSHTLDFSFTPVAPSVYTPFEGPSTTIITQALPIISLSPSPYSGLLNFGTVPVGTSAAPLFVLVGNVGYAPLTINSIGLTTYTGGGFGQTNNCPVPPATLAVGQYCLVTLTMNMPAGTAPGTSAQAVLTLSDNDPYAPQTYSVFAFATFASDAAINPNNLIFGNQPVGTQSATQTVTITNNGNDGGSLILGNVPITQTGSSGFTFTTTCTPNQVLTPTQFCSITVTFAPTAAGFQTGQLSVASNQPEGSDPISLAGTGTGPAPLVQLTPANLAFGTEAVNTTSTSQSVTVSNAGNANLIFGLNPLSAAPAGFNVVADGCSGAVLAPAAGNCVITVNFEPAAAGPYNALLTLTDNGGQQNITLSGKAGNPMAHLSPPNLAFGSQAVNTISAAQSVTVTNTGSDNLTFGPAPLSATPAGYSVVVDTCANAILAPGVGSCTVTVTFQPTAPVPYNAQLTLSDNDGSQVIGLTGTGGLAINIFETIHVTDAPVVSAIKFINVLETIHVTDTPSAGPFIGVFETIHVTDTIASSSDTATTIQTVPSGLKFTVDGGAPQTAPRNLVLSPGPHTIAVAATQAGAPGTQYVFANWSDSGAASHSIQVGALPVTYTASFQTQYQLTTAPSPAAGGGLMPASGTFLNAGSVISVQATANAGYQFADFSGGVLSGSANPQNVTMNGPTYVVANFTPLAPNIAAVAGARIVLGSTVRVGLTLTNTGLGPATNATITSITGISDLSGSGAVTVASGTPVDLGTINPGASQSGTIVFNWPASATRVSFTVNFTADGGYAGSTKLAIIY